MTFTRDPPVWVQLWEYRHDHARSTITYLRAPDPAPGRTVTLPVRDIIKQRRRHQPGAKYTRTLLLVTAHQATGWQLPAYTGPDAT